MNVNELNTTCNFLSKRMLSKGETVLKFSDVFLVSNPFLYSYYFHLFLSNQNRVLILRGLQDIIDRKVFMKTIRKVIIL